jgi:hypothetical protein
MPRVPATARGHYVSRRQPFCGVPIGQPLDATETADFYEICVERHQRASTVVTSNRTAEWLSMMTDPLLAQSAVHRLVSTAHEPIIEGQSCRRRQKPSISHASSVSVDQEKSDHHDHS